jgi:hypothetical protein
VTRGIVAGVAGTALMTAHQEIRSKIRSSGAQGGGGGSSGGNGQPADPWESAPAPAQVARRILEGVFHRPVPAEDISLLTNVMHWTYGVGCGAVYGPVRSSTGGSAVVLGPTFGLAVWAMSYVELVPMGLYRPPWEYPARSLVNDIGYHLTYGVGVGATYALLDPD